MVCGFQAAFPSCAPTGLKSHVCKLMSSSSPVATLAIVGRPNVGKSTLFNRLTHTRDALVSDMPGLTRDRREGLADIGGHAVRVIDTAGLEDGQSGSIQQRMREQSETAVADADVVLFLLDARAGVTPDDEAFANSVRQSGTPVLLVANKCEGRAAEAGLYESYALGFGDPIAVSAEHGEGITELSEAIIERLDLDTRQPTLDDTSTSGDGDDEVGPEGDEGGADFDSRPLRLAIVGRPNAGKSTLVNALLDDDRMITGPEPGLTRDSIATEFRWRDRVVQLFDTAGLRKKAKVSDLAERLSNSNAVRTIRMVEVVVVLIDVERTMEHQDLTIAGLAAEEGRAVVIAFNKWDTVADKSQKMRELREAVEDKLTDLPGVRMVTISALSETGLDKLMQAVFETRAIWNKRIATPALNRWLEEATARHAPPAAQGRAVKLRYISQPAVRPPTFALFCSRPKDLPRSYLRYLSNGLREAFEFPGVPLRLKLRSSDNPFAGKKSRRTR